MSKSLIKIWSTETGICPRFDLIVLDYFFSPAGWVNTRWTEKFFSETLPCFVQKGILSSSGSLWLPHVDHVEEMISSHSEELSQYYSWSLIADPESNPLYSATEKVTDELLRCPDNLTNTTQIRPLIQSSGGPFYRFQPIVQTIPEESIQRVSGKKRKTTAMTKAKRRARGSD
jgi:hypothetical protein